ncbi:MAG: hypothetical protein KJ583_03445 [Nanoarchaeota archaeon]|nr:hypothetical protein [Nanoarchaeota archaeon]MBU1269757.1 hypothetical protein [Nanoarchaeota archaeon]MBU1604349.1 hypothetical protein [Nanoarchaeota archaeon]MBU2443395.1 hypothetical protein [Nanoarchaeota archaeon]
MAEKLNEFYERMKDFVIPQSYDLPPLDTIGGPTLFMSAYERKIREKELVMEQSTQRGVIYKNDKFRR